MLKYIKKKLNLFWKVMRGGTIILLVWRNGEMRKNKQQQSNWNENSFWTKENY